MYYLDVVNNEHLMALVGPQNQNLNRLEKRLGVTIILKGNKLAITGPQRDVDIAKAAIEALYSEVKKDQEIDYATIDRVLKMLTQPVSISKDMASPEFDVSIATKRRMIFPRTPNQARYIKAMSEKEMVFGLGPAGTGKTYLAVAKGVSLLLEGVVDKIILTRPAVEAGEKLGFLPGDMKEKVDPYLRPLYDGLNDMLPPEQVLKRLTNGEIEVAPLAFMRGRTLSNAFVILDEAQNTTSVQMKMFLTRIGPNSRMVINGDLSQIDLPYNVPSGLLDAVHVLRKIKEIAFIEFGPEDVVRHNLVGKIVEAYNKKSKSIRKDDPPLPD
ncbi:MAG: PhoH family protein [Proteobacteria bacterium]|nr:PhoH family protein [Pseudomonadota bacterium]